MLGRSQEETETPDLLSLLFLGVSVHITIVSVNRLKHQREQ